jgi:phytoene synthase
MPEPADPLTPEAGLALAWSAPGLRGPLSTVLQFDRRLARIAARTREPVLGQMRLAWWRDELGKPMAERPRGDAVLDEIGLHWEERKAVLVAMVDGWEALVTAERIGSEQADAFAAGRGGFFAALAPEGASRALTARLEVAGRSWALADAAARISDPAERKVLIAVGLAQASLSSPRFPRALAGLAVLESLARRALLRGGRLLMEGRGAPIAALRAAIFRA